MYGQPSGLGHPGDVPDYNCGEKEVGGVDDTAADSEKPSRSATATPSTAPLSWDNDAQKRLDRVPSLARSMAKTAVENAVRKLGKQHVTSDDFVSICAKFGMTSKGGDT